MGRKSRRERKTGKKPGAARSGGRTGREEDCEGLGRNGSASFWEGAPDHDVRAAERPGRGPSASCICIPRKRGCGPDAVSVPWTSQGLWNVKAPGR